MKRGILGIALVGLIAASERSVWDGVYTEEQSARGKEVYRANCVACHGEALAGAGPASPLTGPLFSSNWNGVSLADLLERIRVSMPLDRPGTLARQDYADVLAFVLSFNKFPAGKTELPKQTEMLAEIKFLSEKP
jgi:mono/diheme cytochrome c family protein